MDKLILRISFFTIYLLIASSSGNCYGKSIYIESEISAKTSQIVKKIENINVLMGSAVFASGTRPKQYDNFEELKKSASQEELKILTKHINGVVRCYSFWALLHYPETDLFSIVKEHLNDDTIVLTQFGCESSEQKVGDFFINLVTPDYVYDEIKKLNEKEFKIIDSLLVYKENNLDSRFRAIETAEITKELYPKVRELVTKYNNQIALVTLAKYKNENDIELILNNKDNNYGNFYTYKAIQNFPDLRFQQFLENNLNSTFNDTHYDNEWRELYIAIATYKNQKALELLSYPFTKVKHPNIKKYHINFVYDAILLNKFNLYDNLLWKIWEEENVLTLNGFKYLLKIDPLRTYQLSKKMLIPNYVLENQISLSVISNDNIFGENLDETILNFILINDKNQAYEIITRKILEAKVIEFEMYCNKVLELKDSYFVEPLFKRLKVEDNAHVYTQIVMTLISFKDESINKRMLETRKQNRNMNKNWGSDYLDKILKKNNIQ
ncbi:hypothetical protein [Flavobacterium nitrogenifigens]|uniref:HEAT repeat-containing protein n=1 Tax=Flavobacterium nitrogenifigens TaxID=1617283 RepID=A0A521DMZ6_9FLAO|nr:hypothetical protein [Flavobacterium nitrogenifigens]KAF2329980.1 hypothetical protein DM397_14685 [Flavobacterium nitrogenifigens]SMO72988.1 hypothetical protein SAMN06265220_103186 [Flavobacterium nitrogenifigens]